MGAAVGAIVTSGTGYYYPPYIGYPPMGYPIYHPYACSYGYYGAYVWFRILQLAHRCIRCIANSLWRVRIGNTHGFV